MTYREAIVSGEKSLCEAGIADARMMHGCF